MSRKHLINTPCRKCGLVDRRPSGRCRPCSRKKEYSYVERNKEKVDEKNRKYRERNREKIKAYSAFHYQMNKAKYHAKSKKYYAMRKQAVPLWFDKEEVDYIYSIAQEKNLEVDHIVPLNSDKVCGLHVQDNLRCISSELNKHKGNRYWSDMWNED